MGVGGILAATLAGKRCVQPRRLLHYTFPVWALFSSKALRRMLLLGLPLVPASLSLWVINSFKQVVCARSYLLPRPGSNLSSRGPAGRSGCAGRNSLSDRLGTLSLSIARQELAEHVYTRTLLYFLALTFAILLPLTLWAGPIIELFSTRAYLPASQLIALTGMASMCSGGHPISLPQA